MPGASRLYSDGASLLSANPAVLAGLGYRLTRHEADGTALTGRIASTCNWRRCFETTTTIKQRWLHSDYAVMSTALDLALLAASWTHVFLAPYTKVEESFNLHATHDVLFYGVEWASLPKVSFLFDID